MNTLRDKFKAWHLKNVIRDVVVQGRPVRTSDSLLRAPVKQAANERDLNPFEIKGSRATGSPSNPRPAQRFMPSRKAEATQRLRLKAVKALHAETKHTEIQLGLMFCILYLPQDYKGKFEAVRADKAAS